VRSKAAIGRAFLKRSRTDARTRAVQKREGYDDNENCFEENEYASIVMASAG